MANSSPSSTTGDEKSHTFRKRRLSLSRHNVAADSDASGSLASNQQQQPHNTGHTVTADSNHQPTVPPLPAEVQTTHSAELAAEEKAHTFRKRRLSLTLKSQVNEGDEANNQGTADVANQETTTTTNGDETSRKRERPEDETPPSAARPTKRRASDASALSNASDQDALRVRTLHADEILGQHSHCPPSPAVAGGQRLLPEGDEEPHVLYRQSRKPSSTNLLTMLAEDAPQQPKWGRRITRQLNEDERKLPFPRHVVGTFSCHGVEPIYDESEYEQCSSSSEEEEDWSEDISGAKASKSGGQMILHKKAPKEPKPTTAAKINQDRGGVAFPYGNCPRTALFAAYDGHGQGGELVSQFALHEIQSRLEKHPEFPTNLQKAFADIFLAVDKALHEEPLIEPLYAGTTACVALLRETTLTVANAGDSRAVIARRCPNIAEGDSEQGAPTYQSIDLTIDQNPDLPEERSRIESMGGFVSPPPEPGLSARVWLDSGFSQIGLAMSRSLGDHAVAQVGVIAEPAVSSHTVVPEDEFMIIATDGVWEFLSSDDAIKIVGDNLSQGATKACQALIEAAAAKWHIEEGDYRDDITALVIRLQELWKDP